MKVPLTWCFLVLVLGQLSIYLRYDLQTISLTTTTPNLYQYLTPTFLFYQSVQNCNGILYILFPYALLAVFVFQFFTMPNRYVVLSYVFIMVIFGIQAVYEYPIMDYFFVQKIPNIILQNYTSSKLPATLTTSQQKQIQEFEFNTLGKLVTLFWLHTFEIFAMFVLMYWQYKVEQLNVGFPLSDSVNEQFLPKIEPQNQDTTELLNKEENPWRIRETEFAEDGSEEDEEEEEEEENVVENKKNQ